MSTNTKKYSKDVTAIVENAFVPHETEEVADKVTGENRALTPEEKMRALFDSLSGEVISTPTIANPDNGQHFVVIMSYELKNGYKDNGDYFLIALKEPSKNITWNMTLPANGKDICELLGEINSYNKGVVYQMNPLQAFGKLQSQKFRVWTQQYKNDKGEERVKTYSNPVKYEKFARYIASQKEAAKSKDAEYKAKKSASRDGKDPWED